MGKASRKKQSLSQTAKPTGRQADSQEGEQAGKPANRQVIHLLIILVIGFLTYSNTLHAPFQWDEADYIVNNPIVKDLGFFAEPSRAVGLMGYSALKSRYIGYLTFALNYKLHGINVFGYHLVNLAIHLINAILVYFLVLLTFRTPYFSNQRSAVSDQQSGDSRFTIHPPRRTRLGRAIYYSRLFALAVALLFVAHPVQTEAVTYVFQRLASLVTLFYLLSLVLYIKGRQLTISYQQSAISSQHVTIHDSRFTAAAWFFLSFAAAVCAMKTKENAFTLPVIITLYEFLFFSGPIKTRLLRLAPFLLTMLIIPMTIIGLDSTAGEIISQIKDPASLGYQELSRNAYLFTQFRVVVTYLRLLFFPVNQNLDYDYPIYSSLFSPPVLLSFVFLAAIFGIALYLVYKTRSEKLKVKSEKAGHEEAANLLPSTFYLLRLAAFGILWFFIALSVESSIIPIPMVIDEYRVYLPSVGFFLALVAGVALLLEKGSRSAIYNARSAKVAFAIFSLVVLALSATAYARNNLWKDKVSLWEDVIAKSPNSPRGYNNLGIAYNEKGMNEKAISMYEQCIKLHPSQKDVHINLGNAYALSGRFEKAVEEFTKAIEITPRSSAAYANLALAYAQTGSFDKAVETYTKAVELDPYSSTSYHGLGTSYLRLGRVEDALAAYTKFVSLSPNDPDAYRNRGFAYSQMGDLRSAREDFQKACSLGSSQGCESLEKIR
jgi:Flp pilus assembly protein TadD